MVYVKNLRLFGREGEVYVVLNVLILPLVVETDTLVELFLCKLVQLLQEFSVGHDQASMSWFVSAILALNVTTRCSVSLETAMPASCSACLRCFSLASAVLMAWL